MLEAHQSLNQQKLQFNNKNFEETEASLLSCSQLNKSWTSPISISTSNIDSINAVQFSPNSSNNNINVIKKSKIPLSDTVNKQMTMLTTHTPLGSTPSSTSSLSPISQQLFLSSPNLSDSNSIDPFKQHRSRPEPPKQLELETNLALKNTKSMISPTTKTEIKIDINGFNKMNQQQHILQHNDLESVYDLPTPPV